MTHCKDVIKWKFKLIFSLGPRIGTERVTEFLIRNLNQINMAHPNIYSSNNTFQFLTDQITSSNNTFEFLTDQITSSNNTFEFLTDQITSSNNTFEFLTDQITSNVDALIISLLFPERQCKIPGYPSLLSLDRDKNGVGIVVMPARTFHSSQTFIFWRKNHWSSSHWTKFPCIKKLRLTCSDNPKKNYISEETIQNSWVFLSIKFRLG